MTPISEAELILPALMLLDRSPEGLNTSQLIERLSATLHPTGDDMSILAGRNDTRFSQKVRNLTSHDTLTQRGLATRGTGRNQPFRITNEGRTLYDAHRDSLDVLTGFSLDDSEPALRQIATNTPIEILDDALIREGELRLRTAEFRTRSRELRMSAVQHHSQNGYIYCSACEFEFSKAYGSTGRGYIQIHHLKPVSFMRGEPMSMSDALANVRPLCANCHQMAHRKTPPLKIADIRSIVRVSYNYSEENPAIPS